LRDLDYCQWDNIKNFITGLIKISQGDFIKDIGELLNLLFELCKPPDASYREFFIKYHSSGLLKLRSSLSGFSKI